ncbi:MAG: B12-binding domain-containing radical SAM protein, partial [Clostridiales bacterium]|nr:B12-binding domain-containing radical SAM protein [Clostridiales bacterium]
MSNVKVLFVIPPYYVYDSLADNSVTMQLPTFTIPYGVLSIIAYTTKHSSQNVDFEIIDLNLHTSSLIQNRSDITTGITDLLTSHITDFKPDIVSISALFNSCYDYIELLTSAIKTVNQDATIVIGGGLATNLYKELLDSFNDLDGACYGEGEIPFCQLVDSQNRLEYLEANPSWITRADLRKKRTPLPNLLVDLDEIPFFNYQLIDLKKYSSRSLDKRYASMPKIEMSIHTSRGCPFDCVFCANGKVHGKKVRYMSVEKVIDEVKQMIQLYNIDVLLIEDDHFLSNKDRAKRILRELSSFGIKVEFPNGIAVYAIDEEIGYLLKLAGVTTISLAIESGSDYVLKHIIKKPLLVSMIKPAVRILMKNEIDVHAFIVTGLPGETDAHRIETRQMLYDVGFDWVKIFIAIPIAGSRLFDICKANGYLKNENYSNFITTKCVISTPDINAEKLENDVYLMNLDINFVNNFNTRNHRYEKAIIYFDNIAKRYPHHAFAHYALALA